MNIKESEELKIKEKIVSKIMKPISSFVIFSLLLSLIMPGILFPISTVSAITAIETSDKKTQEYVNIGLEIAEKGYDTVVGAQEEGNRLKDMWESFWKALKKMDDGLKNAVLIAAVEAFDNLLNTWAYDLASWLASGGEGQGAMFYTEGWGEYLKDTFDAAGGQFVESLGKNWLDFDVCEPSSLSIKMRIGLGIAETNRPTQPDCTITELVGNWDNFVNDPNFLDKFSYVFEPEYNDIGISISMFQKYYQTTARELIGAEKDREEGKGYKSVGERIAGGIIKTPAGLVRDAAGDLVNPETGVKVQTLKAQFGNVFYSAIATFVDTLLGKLFEKLFKEGLSSSSSDDDWYSLLGMIPGLSIPNSPRPQSDLYTGQTGTRAYSGKEAAELRFLDFFTTKKGEGSTYDVLTKLVSCPDPKNPGPEECVITQGMRTAIERKMTLKEAIKGGFINGEAPFGFMDYDANALTRGIPYRSIVILRSYSIVPVSWELAAQIINQYNKGSIYSLNNLISFFESETYPSDKEKRFQGLIDPNWVLKAPGHFCTDTGYGPKIIYDDVIGGNDSNDDGDYLDANDVPPTRTVGRSEYCADYESCIEENNDGSCKYYGYCNEARRVWDLQGSDCPEQFASCKVFSGPGNQVVSYLTNSLDYNGCNIDNAGCNWFCNDYNPFNDIWTCVNQKENILKPCTVTGGCTVSADCEVEQGGYGCFDEKSQVNLYLSQVCNSNSYWWDETAKVCKVIDDCTIKTNEVACETDNCEGYTNYLENNSFEQAPSVTGDLALSWIGDLDYFERVSGNTERVYSDGGRYSIRFFNSGTAITTSFSNKTPIVLPTGNYRVSGWIYSNLNAGKIRVDVYNNTTLLKTKDFDVDVRNEWQPITTDDFPGGNNIRIEVVVTGEQAGLPVSGVAWFDNFRLSESCISTPAILTLVGDLEKDQSKLHLDRDANSCSANEAGCSEFIRIQPNNGTNLIKNSSFEDWPVSTSVPPGWQMGEAVVASGETSTVERISENCPVGNVCLKVKNGGVDALARDFESQNIVGIKGDTTYRVSFWAKSDTSVSDQWYVEFLHQNNPDYYCSKSISDSCTSPFAFGSAAGCPDGEQCIGDWKVIQFPGGGMLSLTNEWRRFVSEPVVTRRGDLGIKLSFDNKTTVTNRPLYIDGIQIEEISAVNPAYSDYTDYGKNNLTYLKQPPVYLGCNGYTETRLSPDPVPGITTEAACQGETLVWRNNGCYRIDPAECLNYAPMCHADEVGCELYTPVPAGQGQPIPGVASLEDYCPGECIGYEAYKQSTTIFESQSELNYFIPNTALQCNAAGIGCTEFTNLDEVAAGGEGREYYQYLRQCIKPQEASCSNFYTWEGSDDTGYQLRIYNFKENASNTPENPLGSPAETIAYNSTNPDSVNWPDYWCRDKLAGDNNRPECCDGPEDLEGNPFCKEFYSEDGGIYYRIYANTIVCSNDCHPLRKTRFGETDEVARNNCVATNGTWDAAGKNCIYNAIVQESIACSAQDASCREYRGNNSGNVFVSFFDDLESGTNANWRIGAISSEALTVGGHSIISQTKTHGASPVTYSNRIELSFAILGATDENGTPGIQYVDYWQCSENSARYGECDNSTTYSCYDRKLNKCVAMDPATNRTCLMDIGERVCGLAENILSPNNTYLVSFWAKSDKKIQTLNVYMYGAVSEPVNTGGKIGTIEVTPEWQYYTVGPFTAADKIQDYSRLRFIGSIMNTAAELGDFQYYIDNVEIKQVYNYVYVAKNSWKTPESCDTNPWAVGGAIFAPQYMLGCERYTDSYGRHHNLKSFTNLCREEAIGCEALINTFNSTSPFAENFNVDDPYADVKVPADNVIYMANRPNYQCSALAKGCTALGSPIMVSTSLGQEVVGYSDVYLISNPDNYSSTLCSSEEVGCQEWQSGSGYYYFKDPGSNVCEYRLAPGNSEWSWFIKGSSSLTPDCPLVQPPVGTPHPNNELGFAGICPGEFNSCTLFVDPATIEGKNLFFNADFSRDSRIEGDCGAPDGWEVDSCGNGGTNEFRDNLYQEVALKANTVYTLSAITGADFNGVDDFWFVFKDCPGIVSYDSSIIEANSTCINSAGEETDDFNGDLPGSDFRRDLCNEGTLFCKEGDSTRSCSYPYWRLLPSYTTDNRDSTRFSGFPINRTGISYSGRFMVPNEQTCKIGIMLEERTNDVMDSKEILGCNFGLQQYIDNNGECDTSGEYIKGLVEEIRLVETGTYTVLETSVDKTNCNGVVNIENYCVPFNDRSRINYKIGENDTSYLNFDADVSDIGINSGIPVSDCAGVCDSNVVLKVRPDRECSNWLYCESYVEKVNPDGSLRNVCLSLGSCSSLDENGNCDNPEPSVNEDKRLSYYGDPEQIKNMTGYSVAGLKLETGDILYGYYPFSQMTQVGNVGKISNGNFESIFTSGREPLGWDEYIQPGTCTDGRGWMAYKFISQNDPSQALEGAYMQLNTSYMAKSSPVDVEKGKYYLTGWVNTMPLKNNTDNKPTGAKVCWTTSLATLNEATNCPVDIPAGSGWTYFNKEINITTSGTIYIVLKNYIADGGDMTCRDCLSGDKENLETTCHISGYSMFDELSLNPVLNVAWHEDAVYQARACRAYPEADSLGCEYLKSNVFIKGQYGYCLTSDPAKPSQCVQWWPVDMILGDFEEEEMLYQIQSPLYYCVEKGQMLALDSGDLLGQFSTLPNNFATDFNNDSGHPTDFIEFEVPEDYLPAIRYPYVTEIILDYRFDPHYEAIRFTDQEIEIHTYYPLLDNFNTDALADTLDNVLNQGVLGFILNTFGVNLDINIGDAVGDIEDTNNLFQNNVLSRIVSNGILGVGLGNGYEVMEIKNEDSDKIGLIPTTYYQRTDLAFWITALIAVVALSQGGIEIIQYWEPAYNLIQGLLPIDYFGFYVHGMLHLDNGAVEANAANTLITLLSTSLNITGQAPDMLIGMFGLFTSMFGIYEDAGDWQELIGIIQDNDSILPDQDAVGWWGVLFGPTSIIQPITDQDDMFHYGKLYDPIPDLPADVLGAAVMLQTQATDGGGSGIRGQFKSDNISIGYCEKLVKVVNEDGKNKAWTSRVFPGSEFVLNEPNLSNSRKNFFLYYDPFKYEEFAAAVANCPDAPLDPPCNKYQSSDYSPFGSVVPPANSQFPPSWDTRTSQYLQPLFYEPPLHSTPAPHQSRMGENHTDDSLKRIFLRSYGIWEWDEDDPDLKSDDSYAQSGDAGWDILKDWGETDGYCPPSGRPNQLSPTTTGNVFPTNDSDLCRVRPQVNNVRINGQLYLENIPLPVASPVVINGTGQVKLEFTVKVDGNQLPITSYSIDWGDGTTAAASGLSLRDRPNLINPFTLSHFYDFWQLQQQWRKCQVAGSDCVPNSISCTADECQIRPSIKIKDNWNAETCQTGAPNCTDENNKYIIIDSPVIVEKPSL